MGSVLAAALMREQPLTEYLTQYEVPLPPQIHLVLDEGYTEKYKQALVIGDVHGCLHELKDLIDSVKATTGDNFLVVFCGDMVNRGPFSCETLAFVRSLGKQAVSVRGNHEDRVIYEWIDRQNNANGKPFSEKYDWVKALSKEDIEYLISLPYLMSIPDFNTVIVHAGLDPWRSLSQQQPKDMVLTRNIIAPDDPCHSLTEGIKCGLPWASCWQGPMHVYYGHDARRGLQQRHYSTGLDTGCVYGKRLTGALLSRSTSDPQNVTRTIISVKARKIYKKKSSGIKSPSCENPGVLDFT